MALEQGQRRRKQEGKGEPYHEPASKQPFTSAHLRPVVSRFGGIVMESAAVDIPVQAGIMNDKGQILSAAMMDNDNDFDSRCKPACSNVYAGIPGYSGYRPHGAHHNVLGESQAPPARDRAMSALDTSKQPYIMPVVGYTGHIRGLADADKNYGTTHWKNSGMVNPNNKAAASLPWDNRDVAGRPYGGWTPGDGGKYEEDPDIEEKKKAAAEANEILELRSMGIRALIQKSPELGGSRGGPPRPEL